MSRNIHLIGIGGSGLSAMARLLVESGYAVSGCDQVASPITAMLQQLGVRVEIGHHPDHVKGMDMIIQSSAVPDDNVEIAKAAALEIPVIKRAEFFQTFLSDKKTIAVAGTHGKTTTTAMIAFLLSKIGVDPGYLIGGISKNFQNNAHAGSSELFVIEADEYDLMFLGLNPSFALLTKVDYDHPDFFPTQAAYDAAFAEFVSCLQPGGVLLMEHENTKALMLLKALPESTACCTYGMSEEADYQAINLQTSSTGTYLFDMKINVPDKSERISKIELRLAGEHNIRNALGALAVIHQTGHDARQAAKYLPNFAGTERRFDIIGEFGGVHLIDDYAHHPTEIRTTLRAARLQYPSQRIIAVWQPHTFTRSKAFFEDFTNAFSEIEEVIITEVYAARESDPDFSASLLAKQLKHQNVRFIADIAAVETFLIRTLQPGDVLIVLSAGDAVSINTSLMNHYTETAAVSSTRANIQKRNRNQVDGC